MRNRTEKATEARRRQAASERSKQKKKWEERLERMGLGMRSGRPCIGPVGNRQELIEFGALYFEAPNNTPIERSQDDEEFALKEQTPFDYYADSSDFTESELSWVIAEESKRIRYQPVKQLHEAPQKLDQKNISVTDEPFYVGAAPWRLVGVWPNVDDFWPNKEAKRPGYRSSVVGHLPALGVV